MMMMMMEPIEWPKSQQYRSRAKEGGTLSIPYPPTSPFELISIRAMYTCHLTLCANVFIEQVTAA